VLRTMERQAKLLGLDTPAQPSASHNPWEDLDEATRRELEAIYAELESLPSFRAMTGPGEAPSGSGDGTDAGTQPPELAP